MPAVISEPEGGNRVILTDKFLESMERRRELSGSKVLEITNNISKNIFPPGLNLETLQGSMRPFLSCRLSQEARIILLNPEKGLYIFMWADLHDAAYQWAETTKVRLAQDGSFQTYRILPGEKKRR